jgi:hypothetical protein
MKTLVEQIIDIDKVAREAVIKASEDARASIVAANAERDALVREYDELAEKKLEAARRQNAKFAEEQIAEIIKRQEEQINRLERAMSENKKAWESEIITRIIGE